MLLADIGANVDVAADGAQAVALAGAEDLPDDPDGPADAGTGRNRGRSDHPGTGPNAHTPILALTPMRSTGPPALSGGGMNDFVASRSIRTPSLACC